MNTRIAPSPTGFFHLGTARTAYHSYLIAKATGGKFILRIDDTDNKRNDPAYTQYILDVMDWLGLKPDLVVYQSDRLNRYKDIADQLCKAGLAYYALTTDNSPVMLKLPDMPSTWHDDIAGDIKIPDADLVYINNMTLIKSDGYPTYNFCSILDDIDLGIDLIIRGTDHLSNTPKQVAIMQALKKIMAVPDIKFMHLGLIHHKVDGKDKKMSKRDGAKSVLDFKDQGYNKDALLNYILKLGWAPRIPNFDSIYKTVSTAQAIDLIFQGNFKASKANFDLDKLNYLDKVYKKMAPSTSG